MASHSREAGVPRAGVWLSGREFRPWVTTFAKAAPRNKKLASSHYKVKDWKQSRAPAGLGCGWAAECFLSTTRSLCLSPSQHCKKNNIKINHIWLVLTVKKEWEKGRDRFQVAQFLFYFWNFFFPNRRLGRVNLNPVSCQVKVERGYDRREQHPEGQWAD